MPTEFRLPELGENIENGELLRLLVSVGDSVNPDQPVLELETDKATIEVPSSVSGKVRAIHVKAGDKVGVGQLILTVDDGTEAKAGPSGETEPTPEEKPKSPKAKPESKAKPEARPKESTPEPVSQPKPTSEGAAAAQSTAADQEEHREESGRQEPPPRELKSTATTRAEVVDISRARPAAAEPEESEQIAPAAPSVRRQARELGVDINEVAGSGPGGRISTKDVTEYVQGIISEPGSASAGLLKRAPLPDFSKWGEIERQPMSNIRRSTAEHLALAWNTVPQVTQYDRADITELEDLRKRFAKRAEAAGGKLTVTAIAVKVVITALRLFPRFAASVDTVANEIVYKKYAHIGVAVDTDRGLLVPVIRDADKRNILEISRELAQLAEKARNKKLAPDEMQGGVFTITNLGGIGGTNFSPIVNYPEVAILGVARASLEPVLAGGQFVPRLMLPLALSYDHRLIDGADAARFLRWVCEAFEQPFLLSLEA